MVLETFEQWLSTSRYNSCEQNCSLSFFFFFRMDIKKEKIEKTMKSLRLKCL